MLFIKQDIHGECNTISDIQHIVLGHHANRNLKS